MAKIDLKADSIETVEESKEAKKAPKKSSATKKTEKAADKVSETVKEEVTEESKKTEAVKEEQKEKTSSRSKKAVTPPLEADKAPEEASNEQAAEEKPKRGRKRKIDEMSQSDQIALHVHHNTYSVEKADKETKREIYSRQQIFVEEGEEEYLRTDETVLREEWIDIVASATEGRILDGTIISVTEVPTNQDKEDPHYVPEYMAKVKFKTGKFNVEIPSYVLYHYEYPVYNRTAAEEIRRNIVRRLGSEIHFIARYTSEKDRMVIGDRLAALSNRGARNYASINGRRPNVREGEQCLAKIIAVARDYIMVDAAGAEIRIPLEEVSWLYVADARMFDGQHLEEDYTIGKRVPVKILSVDFKDVHVLNNRYNLVNATASIRQTKANPKVRFYDNYRINDIYSGVVTGITEDGVYVNINNQMDCRCKLPKNKQIPIPEMGGVINLQITHKDDEQLRIFGKILR